MQKRRLVILSRCSKQQNAMVCEKGISISVVSCFELSASTPQKPTTFATAKDPFALLAKRLAAPDTILSALTMFLSSLGTNRIRTDFSFKILDLSVSRRKDVYKMRTCVYVCVCGFRVDEGRVIVLSPILMVLLLLLPLLCVFSLHQRYVTCETTPQRTISERSWPCCANLTERTTHGTRSVHPRGLVGSVPTEPIGRQQEW